MLCSRESAAGAAGEHFLPNLMSQPARLPACLLACLIAVILSQDTNLTNQPGLVLQSAIQYGAFSAVHVLNMTNQPTRFKTIQSDGAMSLSAQGKLGSYCIICSACGAYGAYGAYGAVHVVQFKDVHF